MSPCRERPLKRTNPSGQVVWVARFTDSQGRRRVARPPWNKGKGTFDREYKAQDAIDWAHEQDRRSQSDTIAGYFSTWTQVHPRAERTNETNRHRISRVLDIEVDGVPFRAGSCATCAGVTSTSSSMRCFATRGGRRPAR